MAGYTPFDVDVMSVETSSSLAEIVSVLCSSPGRKDADDPFYVVDLGTIIGKVIEWKRLLPRVSPFYAIKCNDDPVLVRLLAALGLGFDCASKTEIKTVLDIGLGPERIVYANPCKQLSHLRYAAQQGVSLMTFDNEYELHKIKANYPSAKLLLRVKVDDSKSICQFNIKFGVTPEDALSLFKTAKELELDVVGVSFHVGSGCCDAKAFSQAIRVARNAIDDAVVAGFVPSVLDIGGGFPGTSDAAVSFEEVAVELDYALNEHFPVGCGIEIIAEPGRFFAAASHTLVTNVTSKRLVDWETNNELSCDMTDGVTANTHFTSPETETDIQKGFMYYLNEGVYSSFNCIVFDHVNCPNPQTLKAKDGPLYPSSLWGPTCDSMDKIKKYCEVPELDIGEWVFFEEMGAYTKSAASTFNGFSKAHSYYIISKELKSEIQQLWSKVLYAHDMSSYMEQPRQMHPLSFTALKCLSCNVA